MKLYNIINWITKTHAYILVKEARRGQAACRRSAPLLGRCDSVVQSCGEIGIKAIWLKSFGLMHCPSTMSSRILCPRSRYVRHKFSKAASYPNGICIMPAHIIPAPSRRYQPNHNSFSWIPDHNEWGRAKGRQRDLDDAVLL